MKIIDTQSFYTHPKHLAIYRVLYCTLLITFVGLPSFTWINSNLNLFFDPPAISISNLFSGFPSANFFFLLSIINLISFALMFLGITSKSASIVFTVSSILGHNFWYSFGKIDHLLIWYSLPLFLCFAGWSDYYSITNKQGRGILTEEKKQRIGFILSLLALLIGFTMFTSGVQKIMGGWWKWDREAVRFHLISNYFTLQRTDFLAGFFLHLKSHVIWKFFDYAALIMELGFIVAVFRKAWFQLFLLSAFVFHVLVLLMFNIAFFSNVIAYMIFLNWDSIGSYYNQNIRVHLQFLEKMWKVVFLIGGGLICFWIYFTLSRKSFFRLPGLLDLPLANSKGFQDPSFLSLALLFSVLTLLVFFATAIEIKRILKRSN
jgi:hypothetical protein